MGPRLNDGQRNFRLGAVEVAVVVAGALLIGWLLRQQYLAFTETQQQTAQQVSTLVTEVAVLTDQVHTLTLQLADVPQLTKQVAQLQVIQQDHERRLEILEKEIGPPLADTRRKPPSR